MTEENERIIRSHRRESDFGGRLYWVFVLVFALIILISLIVWG